MGLVIRLEPSRLRMKQWRCSSLAPEVCWLMSKRPQKCNLISSVNLDRKWPKQNWFELRNISMSPCHIVTVAEKSKKKGSKCYNIVQFCCMNLGGGQRARSAFDWCWEVNKMMTVKKLTEGECPGRVLRWSPNVQWTNCREDDKPDISTNQRRKISHHCSVKLCPLCTLLRVQSQILARNYALYSPKYKYTWKYVSDSLVRLWR